MGPIRPLDAIIHKVPPRTKVNPPAERLVIIDCKTKKFWTFGELRYYLVVNTSDGENPAEYQVPAIIPDIENDRSLGLNVKCWISCPPGNEDKVAEALFSTEQPTTAVFEKLIKKWIDEF